MQHFFADPSCVDGEQIRLAGSDVNHMKNVLRMKPGEEVWVSDGEGMDYFCSVEGYVIRKCAADCGKMQL